MNVLGGISGYRNMYSSWRFRVKPHVIRPSVNQANTAISGPDMRAYWTLCIIVFGGPVTVLDQSVRCQVKCTEARQDLFS